MLPGGVPDRVDRTGVLAYEVIPVHQIDNITYQVGPQTRRIMKIYQTLTSKLHFALENTK